MQAKYCLAVLCLFPILALSQNQSSTTNLPLKQSAVTNAKVENVILDRFAHTATIRIRNLSNSDITAFAIEIESTVTQDKPQKSGNINDLLPGIQSGQVQGVHPGASYDEVVNIGVAENVAATLTVAIYSDASAEFSDPDMLTQITEERKATVDAAKQTEEIIRTSASKAEAVAKLTQLWEWAKNDHTLTAPLLQMHLYNLKNQAAGSDTEQKAHMVAYADQASKESKFFSLHATLHGKPQ